MKPQDRNYQTATQVKVLSPVILHVAEAESFHILEGKKMTVAMVRMASLCRGLSPQYGSECSLQELGRSKQFSRKGILANNLERREGRNGGLEVGLLRSRGVTEVTLCENNVHSKGAAVVCRGRGGHSPYKEMV